MAAGDNAYWSDIASLLKPPAGKAFATTAQTGIGTSETVSLTVPGMLFTAGWAYRVHIRTAVYGTAALQALFRIRKTNASGTDWGEFGRVRTEGVSAGTAAMVNGSLILLRSAGTNLTADVALTCQASSSTVSLFASASSPRYLIVEPIGDATEYEDLGVEVS